MRRCAETSAVLADRARYWARALPGGRPWAAPACDARDASPVLMRCSSCSLDPSPTLALCSYCRRDPVPSLFQPLEAARAEAVVDACILARGRKGGGGGGGGGSGITAPNLVSWKAGFSTGRGALDGSDPDNGTTHATPGAFGFTIRTWRDRFPCTSLPLPPWPPLSVPFCFLVADRS